MNEKSQNETKKKPNIKWEEREITRCVETENEEMINRVTENSRGINDRAFLFLLRAFCRPVHCFGSEEKKSPRARCYRGAFFTASTCARKSKARACFIVINRRSFCALSFGCARSCEKSGVTNCTQRRAAAEKPRTRASRTHAISPTTKST